MWRGHACETDASIGKGISMSDHWCKGARYVRYATGGSGAYRTCAGLQRGASWASACLAGASRFEALLLNHRRRLPDAIVLVNARTPCSTTEGGGRPCVLAEKSIDTTSARSCSTWNANLMSRERKPAPACIVSGRRTAQKRVTGGRSRRIGLGHVLAEQALELRGRARVWP